MKRFLLASAGVLAAAGLIGAASAADLGRRAPPPLVTKAPPMAPYFSWTGLYAGLNGGYGWGRSKWSDLGSNFNLNGGLFGGQVGYNWQFGQFVYGLEGDVDWSDVRGTAGVVTTRNSMLSTVRGRVGFAADRWMPYLTGGLAIGNIRATVPGFAGIDQTNTGWTVGGGVEYALPGLFSLPGNWSVKAEYLHVDLGNAACAAACDLPAGNNVGLTTNIIRGGVNYHF